MQICGNINIDNEIRPFIVKSVARMFDRFFAGYSLGRFLKPFFKVAVIAGKVTKRIFSMKPVDFVLGGVAAAHRPALRASFEITP